MTPTAVLADSVVNLLRTQSGYALAPKPLHIADIEFDFDFHAVLSGPHSEQTLLFVADVSLTPVLAVERRIRALGAAISRGGFSCPVTLVVVAEDSQLVDTTRLEQLCRVLVLRPADSMERRLTSLLPLKLPDATVQATSAQKELKESLGAIAEHPLVKELVRAALSGGDAVSERLCRAFDEAAKLDGPQEDEK